MVKKIAEKVKLAGYGLRRRAERILSSQDGVGTVEVVLLILVAVGLVLIFKDRITELVTSIFNRITSQAGKV
ncbi:MAG TPA: hypothetical protein H9763_09440 [Candidatus Eisenbergiella merdigallinarum]|uniref:Putative Flagellin Flp1-like domain-containing protein n=1 Tax=Candidatus Eisenbergiella merdigallinarum TaxID=2838552 RepID=A0A9D2MRQ0_9FIRM|nr:hypothetical protein [Candidatus Eisenbergiella merdigallinarum]